MMTRCNDCSADISTAAKICPKCGRPAHPAVEFLNTLSLDLCVSAFGFMAMGIAVLVFLDVILGVEVAERVKAFLTF